MLVTGAGPIGLLAALLGAQRGLEVHMLDHDTDGPKPELARADRSWLEAMISRGVPLEDFASAVEKQRGDVKVVLEL